MSNRRRTLEIIWQHGGMVMYNTFFTFVPSHVFRIAMLRLWGANIGHDSAIQIGTTVLGIECLTIGSNTRIGSRCLLDARGDLSIGDGVVVSDDTQFIAGHHEPNTDDFYPQVASIRVEDSVWIGARTMVVDGLTIGRGAVVGAGSLVRRNVAERDIVAGIPTRTIGHRTVELGHRPTTRRYFA
jgi:putative colanic acid biosynthesis acetyltransferase WcaF